MIYTLQYLRAIAAIMVVMSHIAFKSTVAGADVFGGFRIGASGVDVFFVISGFVMAMIYWRTPHGIPSAGDFWLKRFVRIFPMYWLVTTAALALYLLSPSLVNANSGPTSIWRSYTLIPTLQQSDITFLIGPGWSLSFELYFYTIFSLIFLIPARRAGLTTALAIVLLLACGSLSGMFVTYLFTSPLLLEFAFGMLIFAWFAKARGRLPVMAGLACLAGGIGGFALLNMPGAFVLSERWWQAGIPAALLIVGALSLEPWAMARPSRLWLLLGDASYSLYLIHVFVLGAASRAFGLLQLRNYGPGVEIAFWCATLLATIAAGCIAHRLIERPMTRWIASRVRSWIASSWKFADRAPA
ncbi:peptidoglycan/LPS O-acetylase OafA/YrhL [Luteibacter rhizovicinus]|uniref:Peptidoglycan/LPS O-acetylase OafA/YrhL n=1 Tax=Luteibacter rhizovicinus TaxID=242606 RepID=A0A4R3YJJ1_9GAMM|nr:acyltransferase [Luteibacter rhizovicinus]TCV92865.1 peptidoglycan/LPS O-acetylase OafA/YrhL [Luteibacter rhizovicinus]